MQQRPLDFLLRGVQASGELNTTLLIIHAPGRGPIDFKSNGSSLFGIGLDLGLGLVSRLHVVAMRGFHLSNLGGALSQFSGEEKEFVFNRRDLFTKVR